MIQFLHTFRFPLAVAGATATYYVLRDHVGLPAYGTNALLDSLSPNAFRTFKILWFVSLFGVLFGFLWLPLIAGVRRLWPERKKADKLGALPPYPDAESRETLYCVLGEQHGKKLLEPSASPTWMVIPEEGLYLGVMAMGSSGSGKTRSVLLPATDQLMAYRCRDKERRIGGLVLEVKGDFCGQVETILKSHGRAEDYVELGLEGQYSYNPLHNDMDASTLAYNVIGLMKTLYGASRESYWEQAAEELVTFVIMLFRLRCGYVTLYDLYAACNNPKQLNKMMEDAAQEFDLRVLVLEKEVYLKLKPAQRKIIEKGYSWEDDPDGGQIRTKWEQELEIYLASIADEDEGISFKIKKIPEPDNKEYQDRKARFTATKIYHGKWADRDADHRSKISSNIEVFLKPFSFNPDARRMFCPPAEAYDPKANAGGLFGKPLPPLEQLIETPAVICLKFSMNEDEGLARIIGTFLKQDWMRAVLKRTVKITKQRLTGEEWRSRPLALVMDEYQLLATGGGRSPGGDEKFANLSRAARCITIVGFQSISSLKSTVAADIWPVIFQGFATKLNLRTEDLATAEHMSKMCGQEEIIRDSWSLGEGQHQVTPGLANGQLQGQATHLNVGRSWNVVREYPITPKMLMELPQYAAVVNAHNGTEKIQPTIVYLKPFGEDTSVSWFDRKKAKSG